MTEQMPHQPVMVSEILAHLETTAARVFVDATVGAAGHAAAMLAAFPEATLVGIDQDPDALVEAGRRLAGFRPERVILRQGNFRDLAPLLDGIPLAAGAVDAILMDLGVSSMQFDRAARGFTYSAPEAPLDMRMNPAQSLTAAGLLNQAEERELSRIIRDYGEERWASRIAAFVVAARSRRPLTTAGDLVDLIRAAIPASARRQGGHPARRTFQALRIAVNDELGALQEALPVAAGRLAPGGRLLVISFHSLEDRIVKDTFRRLVADGGFTVATRRPVSPGEAEQDVNPRSRSAKLRVLIKPADSIATATAGEGEAGRGAGRC